MPLVDPTVHDPHLCMCLYCRHLLGLAVPDLSASAAPEARTPEAGRIVREGTIQIQPDGTLLVQHFAVEHMETSELETIVEDRVLAAAQGIHRHRAAKTEFVAPSPVRAEGLAEAEVLAQVRQMCHVMVATSGIGKRVHEFALSIWCHIEKAFPGMTPNDWNALVQEHAALAASASARPQETT